MPVFDEQQDKSHAFFVSNLKDDAELLGAWREAKSYKCFVKNLVKMNVDMPMKKR